MLYLPYTPWPYNLDFRPKHDNKISKISSQDPLSTKGTWTKVESRKKMGPSDTNTTSMKRKGDSLQEPREKLRIIVGTNPKYNSDVFTSDAKLSSLLDEGEIEKIHKMFGRYANDICETIVKRRTALGSYAPSAQDWDLPDFNNISEVLRSLADPEHLWDLIDLDYKTLHYINIMNFRWYFSWENEKEAKTILNCILNGTPLFGYERAIHWLPVGVHCENLILDSCPHLRYIERANIGNLFIKNMKSFVCTKDVVVYGDDCVTLSGEYGVKFPPHRYPKGTIFRTLYNKYIFKFCGFQRNKLQCSITDKKIPNIPNGFECCFKGNLAETIGTFAGVIDKKKIETGLIVSMLGMNIDVFIYLATLLDDDEILTDVRMLGIEMSSDNIHFSNWVSPFFGICLWYEHPPHKKCLKSLLDEDIVFENEDIKCLPKGVRLNSITFKNCKVKQLSYFCAKNLTLENCDELVELSNVRITDSLTIKSCKNLEKLPEFIYVKKLHLEDISLEIPKSLWYDNITQRAPV